MRRGEGAWYTRLQSRLNFLHFARAALGLHGGADTVVTIARRIRPLNAGLHRDGLAVCVGERSSPYATEVASTEAAFIATGAVVLCLSAGVLFGQFRVQPLRPVEELRNEALRALPPVEKGSFRKPDLVDLATLGAGIHFDIRYATADNFLGAPLYSEARAFLERPAAGALLAAAADLRAQGYGILIHDAYRPWYVTKVFWDATPSSLHTFVANPAKGSKHNRGCAVDLSLYDLRSGKPVAMPSGYDEMTPRAHPGYRGGSDEQRRHRDLLRRAMEAHGFTVDAGEWWHFDYRDWPRYPILNIPFERIGLTRISGGAL